MTIRLFIDGAAGTTGLEIRERIATRPDITLVTIPDAQRKDSHARADALNQADAVILCLPDDAAREAVALIENPDVRIIDASTAFRTAPDWAYGFPELSRDSRAHIAASKRISNPGCYPTGFLALVRPLIDAGLIAPDQLLSTNATSGYSGGGKAMIAAFENPEAEGATETAFRVYGLDLAHKHVPEMQTHAGLTHPPIFQPAVARTYRGMLVEVPLHRAQIQGEVSDLRAALADSYAGSRLISIGDSAARLLTIEHCAHTDRIELFVFANEGSGHIRLVALLDNLGKGAGGAAVQNLNIAMGLEESTGLRL